MLSPHSASPRREESGGQWGREQEQDPAFEMWKATYIYGQHHNHSQTKTEEKGAINESCTFLESLEPKQDCKRTNKHRLVSNHCLVCLKCSLARSMYHFGSSDPCLFPQVSLPPSISQLGEELDGCHGLVSSSDWGVASWHRTEARGNA